MEVIYCPACGSTSTKALQTMKKKRPNKESMIAYKCLNCNCEWVE